jgi:hypothetical protein
VSIVLRRLVLYALVACLPAPAAAAQSATTTPQAVAVKVCSGCHTMQIVMDTPKDIDAWHDTVQAMLDRGAQATPEELDLIMQFLFENVTTVDVNHADVETLMTVLHAPQQAADAITSRRQKQPFKDLADLEDFVPGLDRGLLDSKKRMIFFQ